MGLMYEDNEILVKKIF